MQKKFQVFISSTYTDLIEERKTVQKILLMADCIPAGMEAFVAANDEQFEVIKKVIDLCDYYVLIIGGRYGSINKSTGLSYTEMEYEYAVSKGIPILVFAIDEKISLPNDKKDLNLDIINKLQKFRSKAMTNRLASIWKDNGELAGQVAISIMKAKNENARPGWIRGGEFDPTENLKKINLLQEENKNLLEENSSLQKTIDELSNTNQNLAFEDSLINIQYTYDHYNGTRYNSSKTSQDISLKDIFAYVSINMINVSISALSLENYIAKSVGAVGVHRLVDENVAKRICNQFIALKLMKTEFINGKGLYYYLTKKGEKLRDELNLFKKEV